MTLEALKFYGLNHDVGIGDVYYVGANTSWMVWNTLAYNLMCGASVVTYAGSPTFGRADRQFDIIARTGTTMFTSGAAYLSLVQSANLSPGRDWDLRGCGRSCPPAHRFPTPPGSGSTNTSKPTSTSDRTPVAPKSAVPSSVPIRSNQSTSVDCRGLSSVWRCKPGMIPAPV